jgi:thioredoxin 1
VNNLTSDEELEKIKQKMMKTIIKKAVPQNNIWPKGKIHELNESIFNKFLSESSYPIIVDFWAEWCSPCKLMAPIFQNLAIKYAGRVIFAKVNIDQNQRIASQYNVMSIPNLILFKYGKPINRIIGAVGQSNLEAFIQRHL